VSQPGTLTWFARHECRLAWRDWLWMMTAGRRSRARNVAIGIVLFALFLHGVAWFMVGGFAPPGDHPDKAALLLVSGNVLLAAALMLSQAMESVTRAFYSRADLDLILSSPASARRLFAVRIGAMALSITAMALLLAAPFLNILAFQGGWHWLGAYCAIAAMGMAATALAVALTVALFRVIGPKRTRLVAQIVAAVIGAAFVIGLQVAAILSTGTLSRLDILQSESLLAMAPAPESLLWWPARAMIGETLPLLAVLAIGAAMLGAAIAVFARVFAGHAVAAAGLAYGSTKRTGRTGAFRSPTPMAALRRKEWTLLRRDPWLVSQTLMQLLYLLPPALLLWRSFAAGIDAPALLAPVLIMAAGQLAGGLAWLAISGEDAPDLIASAPILPRQVTRAKVQAVLAAVAMVFTPPLAALALLSPFAALMAAVFTLLGAGSATMIQLWFRSQAKRSQFRRRQTSSRVATFAEALCSVGWAATGALAALGNWGAFLTGLIVLGILAGARMLSPDRRGR
jgi:ABC-2 type transport system permease protein